MFDNRRVVKALGARAMPFSDYAHPLLRFATEGKFTYPYRPYPDDAEARASPRPRRGPQAGGASGAAVEQS